MISNCKVCGKEPKVELSSVDGFYIVLCESDLQSDDPHYINMLAPTQEDAIIKWEMLMKPDVAN